MTASRAAERRAVLAAVLAFVAVIALALGLHTDDEPPEGRAKQADDAWCAGTFSNRFADNAIVAFPRTPLSPEQTMALSRHPAANGCLAGTTGPGGG